MDGGSNTGAVEHWGGSSEHPWERQGRCQRKEGLRGGEGCAGVFTGTVGGGRSQAGAGMALQVAPGKAGKVEHCSWGAGLV